LVARARRFAREIVLGDTFASVSPFTMSAFCSG
jgi:hypothetical protein